MGTAFGNHGPINYNGPNNWQGGVSGGANGNGNVITIGPSVPPGPSYSFNNFESTTTTIPQTSLEVFEELVGLIKLIELKLNLDPKDKNKDKWLESIMGRIQEEAINDTIQRLRALQL